MHHGSRNHSARLESKNRGNHIVTDRRGASVKP